ncbi:hypothetical protein ACOSQ2_027625 [Xanthoceras sorbifolium]
MTVKWNDLMSYQACDLKGEPLLGTNLNEVCFVFRSFFHFCTFFDQFVVLYHLNKKFFFPILKKIYIFFPQIKLIADILLFLLCRSGNLLMLQKMTNSSTHILQTR